MKQILLIFCIVVGSLAGIVFNRYYYVFKASNKISSEQKAKAETIINQRYGIPKKIIIPKLNIDTNIEPVGTDNEGNMDVPKDPFNTGWYMPGVRPGDFGSAVIDGHLDTKTGPAVFYKLNNLQRGDKIQIIDENERTLSFTVTGKISFKDDNFPINTIFNRNDKQRLNMITCNGFYDSKKQNYTQRLVVFSELDK